MRSELGLGGIVVTTNWTSADPRVLSPVDKWTDMAGDALALNGYFGGEVRGPQGGFGFPPGNWYRDVSALLEPEQGVLMQWQYADAGQDFPHLWTEGLWQEPNRYRTEGVPLFAVYGALQGTDACGLFWIDPAWQNEATVWGISTPTTLGQFPAAALMYRRGDLREASAVVRESLPLESLLNLQGAAVASPQALDAYRSGEAPKNADSSTATPAGSLIDPLAFFAGRMVRVIADNPPPGEIDPRLGELVDRERKRIRSVTGEVELDYGRGLLRVNAPRAWGVTGFLSTAGEVSLGGVSIRSPMEYGSIWVVSLDGKSVDESRRLLVQVMSEEQNSGWRTVPHVGDDGKTYNKILSAGSAPLLVRELRGTVTLPGPTPYPITPLDASGQPHCDTGRQSTLTLLPTTFHYLLER